MKYKHVIKALRPARLAAALLTLSLLGGCGGAQGSGAQSKYVEVSETYSYAPRLSYGTFSVGPEGTLTRVDASHMEHAPGNLTGSLQVAIMNANHQDYYLAARKDGLEFYTDTEHLPFIIVTAPLGDAFCYTCRKKENDPREQRTGDLVLVRGEEVVTLSEIVESRIEPVFSVDGAHLLYTETDDGIYRLKHFNGKETTDVAASADMIYPVHVTNDGKCLVYMQGSRSDFVMISVTDGKKTELGPATPALFTGGGTACINADGSQYFLAHSDGTHLYKNGEKIATADPLPAYVLAPYGAETWHASGGYVQNQYVGIRDFVDAVYYYRNALYRLDENHASRQVAVGVTNVLDITLLSDGNTVLYQKEDTDGLFRTDTSAETPAEEQLTDMAVSTFAYYEKEKRLLWQSEGKFYTKAEGAEPEEITDVTPGEGWHKIVARPQFVIIFNAEDVWFSTDGKQFRQL